MKIAVIGANGMMGTTLTVLFSERGHSVYRYDKVIGGYYGVEFLDVRSIDRLFMEMRRISPDVLINLAAMTDLEECEKFSDLAYETNAVGSANCAVIAGALDIPYVYVSTAGIFDGKKDFYTEADTPNPINVYGTAKCWGEEFAQLNPMHIVMRCGWSMGGGGKDKKFVNKMFKQIQAGFQKLDVVDDKLGTPTYVKDFANQMLYMIEHNWYGLWNSVCQGDASRYDVAVKLVELLGVSDRITINRVSSDYFAKEYFAPRPPCERLINAKLDKCGINFMHPWEECLEDYVTKDFRHYFSLKGTKWDPLKIAS